MADITSKNNNTSSGQIAFFDLDRTITSAISGKELAKGAFRKGIMKNTDVIHGLLLSAFLRAGFRSQIKIITDLVKWVKGMPEETLLELCDDVTGNILIPSVYEGARDRIASHKAEGTKVVILSSALKCICKRMSENLGMDDILCSELEVIDGVLTGYPKAKIFFGEEKLSRFLEYCWKNGTSVEDTWYYADSVFDIPVLSVTGHPVCVNPDRKLRREAGKKGWEILIFE
jgi:HAD superfamily hydrolase (TIGR01490 family)